MPVSRSLRLSANTYTHQDTNLPPGFTTWNLQTLFYYYRNADRITSHRINFAPNGIHVRRWGERQLTYHPTNRILTIMNRWSGRMEYIVLFYAQLTSRNLPSLYSGTKAVIMVVETGNLYLVRGR